MPTPPLNDDLAFQLRRSVNNAYAFVRGREAASSFLTLTFEDLAAAQVERLSGKGANPTRPNEIDRIKKIEADIISAANQIKQTPADSVNPQNNETNVNTPVLRPLARLCVCDTCHHMTQKSSDMTSITVRISVPMAQEIDKLVMEEKKQRMGSPYTRSDALRDLVREAIHARRQNEKKERT